ncbi:copper resistance protein CopC [Paenibacillus sp. LHD-38]|uniref:copper resistance CopC family protein n=1 Tax=Paenibacillus sp. LHD-38 TaxID=3072143 RepID=UPI00280EB7BC|nr:copper resistance protein CopC [Paenibacillus sp. LHD-38]MDQ8738864.1 copper resistance protein CopC [Paenibacillus sp. LHD-38]
MKRILLICLAALWLLPSVALAHSKLENAVPAQDATITASPERIELTFNTKIENLSNFKIVNAAGEEMEKDKVAVEGMTMSGTVPTPLTNGIYTVKWVIIGADGHSVEGDYSFTLEAPAATEETSPEPEASAEPDTGTNEGKGNPSSTTERDSTNYTPAIIIGAIIAAAAIALFMRRRK